jgi:hypothetical protein
MKLAELKDWVDSLPPQYLDYIVMCGEITNSYEEDAEYIVDHRITTLLIDKEHREAVILRNPTPLMITNASILPI